ncbi:MAG: hypothetical protein J0H89_14260, partial [Rhizobiales bacterium]|nr:hypothetical protein [Hyphomicrobiales bacterium]
MSDTDLIGDEDVEIETTLNGSLLKRRVKARQHLADFLRQEMELTGTHLGTARVVVIADWLFT